MDTKTTPQPTKPNKLNRLWLAVTHAVEQGLETVAPSKPRPAPMRPVQPGYLDIAARPFGFVAGAAAQGVLEQASREKKERDLLGHEWSSFSLPDYARSPNHTPAGLVYWDY